MLEVGLYHLKKEYFSAPIFSDVSIEVKTGERLALLGDNGSGKTTLFRIILGEENYQEGERIIRKGIRVGCLKQVPDTYNNLELSVEYILRLAFKPLNDIKSEIEQLSHQLSVESTLAKDNMAILMRQLGEKQDTFERLGGYEMDLLLSQVALGMGMTPQFLTKKYAVLSGGEKTRVMLAKLLLEKPDVLLLDEPTNHLDLTAITWLENYLKQYAGACLIVSHDRYFLDQIVQKIYEIKQGKSEIYEGNYSDYLEEREKRYESQMVLFKAQTRKKEQMEAAAKRMRDWANRADNEKMYIRARAMERRIDRMDMIDKPVKDTHQLRLQFESEVKAGKIIFKLEEFSLKIEERTLIQEVSFTVMNGERIAIIGENGSGKSTLLNTLLQYSNGAKDGFSADSPIKINPRIQIGYLPQKVTFENEDQSVLEVFKSAYPQSDELCRSYLARFDFKQEDVFTKVALLSGGERVRLKLGMLMKESINCLLLDEPTNHLDIKTREVIENAMDEFEGTVVFVSHDRFLLNKLAERMVVLEDGCCFETLGGYTEYLTSSLKKEDKPEAKIEMTAEQKKDDLKQVEKQKKTNPIYIKKLEAEIEQLETEIKMQQEALSLAASDYLELEKIQLEMKRLDHALSELYEKYYSSV